LEYPEAMRKGFEAGKTTEQIANDYFGFSAKQAELTEAATNRRIEEEVTKRTAEKLKESGVVIRNQPNRPRHMLFDRKSNSNNGNNVAVKEDPNANKDIPTNKFGDKEVFRNSSRYDESKKSTYF